MKRSDIAGLTIALSPFLMLLIVVGVLTNWQFTYTLDDPYIHLALAKGISNFHYGINPSEASAPSSSILWPFLMAPFAHLQGFRLAPLILNSVCLLGTLLVLQYLLTSRFGVRRDSSWIVTIILGFCLNIYGLVFTGMEHSLQVFLTVVIASALAQRHLNIWLWSSLLALPLVRYEGLAISLPILCYLAFQGRVTRTKALFTGLILMIGLVSFSAFLAGIGLGLLPSSVFAKQPATTAGTAFGLLKAIASGVLANAYSPPTFTVDGFALLAGFTAWSTNRARVLLLLAAPAILHLCLGRNGWFGRYEVSILLYLLIVSADLFMNQVDSLPAFLSSASLGEQTGARRISKGSTLFSLALIFVVGTKPLWQSTLLTPFAARNIQDQQIQMALIASQYLDRPVAVNDLGAVALSSRRYVLDLWGLGSYDALSLRMAPKNDPRLWIPRLMAQKGVRHAFVYDSWFPETPHNWIRVAILKLPGMKVTPASDVVTLYATSPASADDLTVALVRYKAENPSKASMVRLVRTEGGKQDSGGGH